MFSENMLLPVGKTFGCRTVKGDVGIEIETEGRNLAMGKITQSFSGKEDGSLRNGMEYVSSPIPANEVEERVNNLAKALADKGCVIDPSYRSSTHIHVNYTEDPFRNVLGGIIAWTIVEPVVFHGLPPGRDGSLFCVSSYDSGDLTEYIDQFCRQIGQRFQAGFNPRGKYSSLNISRLSDLGTLEYRVFPTSLDGKQIQTWTNWLMNLRDIVRKEEDPSFMSLVKRAEGNPVDFLGSVFNDCPVPVEQAGEFVDFGVRHAYELARVVNQHLKEKPKAQKKEKEVAPAQPDVVFRWAQGGLVDAGWPVPVPAPAQPAAPERVGNPQPVVPNEGALIRAARQRVARLQERVNFYERAGRPDQVRYYQNRVRIRQQELDNLLALGNAAQAMQDEVEF